MIDTGIGLSTDQLSARFKKSALDRGRVARERRAIREVARESRQFTPLLLSVLPSLSLSLLPLRRVYKINPFIVGRHDV